MILKSLEIKGFKSFADKTIFHFDRGITGIIGPNGCGKSNVIDAIRWVIGEQKISHLRSENLESLIFNGSNTRNGSALAEVCLVFENNQSKLPTEYSEVSIMRRFYKSGDSEYRLNDVICRLKDIQNLLLDTGVSSDSYAIIELGMVDDIIKDKESSRRRMFEQAAGITIYKNRKKEASTKLDQTEQDLNRIEDILFEIQTQLKSLESQAQKAQRFQELKSEYKKYSFEWAILNTREYKEKLQQLQAKLQQLQDTKQAVEAKLHLENAGYESIMNNLTTQEKQVQSEREKLASLTRHILEIENEKKLALQKEHFYNEKKQQIQIFIQKTIKNIQEFFNYKEKIESTIAAENNIFTELTQQVFTKKTALIEKQANLSLKKAELEQSQKTNAQHQQQKFEGEKKMVSLDTKLDHILKTKAQYQQEIESKKNYIIRLENDLQDINHRAQILVEQKNDEELQQSQLQQKLLEWQTRFEESKNAKNDLTRNLDVKKNEYALLKNLVESLEGYPDSVKYLSKATDWTIKAPLLSEILFVQEKYRIAIEAILEPYLSYFVVQNITQAIEALYILKNKQKGKANFFILSELKKNFKLQNIEPPAHCIAAIDCIEVDHDFKILFAYLLENIYITSQDEVPAQVPANYSLLNTNGNWLIKNYVLSGGSIGAFEGKKVGRTKNLEKLLPEINTIQDKINSIQVDIQAIQTEMNQIQDKIKHNNLKKIEQEIVNNNQSLNSCVQKIELWQQQIQSINQLLEKLETQQQTLLIEKKEIDHVILHSTDHFTKDREVLLQLQEAYNAFELEYSASQNELNNLQLDTEKQQNKVQSMKQELQYKSTQNAQSEMQLKDFEADQIRLHEQEQNDKIKLQELEISLKNQIIVKDEFSQKLVTLETHFQQQKVQQFKNQDQLKLIQKEKQQIETEFFDVNNEYNELKLSLAGVSERLKIEFNVDLNSLLMQHIEVENTIEFLQDKVEKIKKRIDNMGEVNPTAIEAFNEMKLRYDFIAKQRDDLLNAKLSLQQTIKEVEDSANSQFLDTFTKVRSHFQDVFKVLFTPEDTADLILSNPNNLADTAIDIVAKPKGKRPSSINQLSGGEKTLTATALLFSIYLIKPAPFCIFDEVDAPLDDVNVDKFTKLIRKFSENSQFIIVTHNKQTMNNVDVIYGVTMQEVGVSKIVPVDFRNLE